MPPGILSAHDGAGVRFPWFAGRLGFRLIVDSSRSVGDVREASEWGIMLLTVEDIRGFGPSRSHDRESEVEPMRNPIRRIRPERTGVRAPLGDLEHAIMQHVWDRADEGCLAVDVQSALEEGGNRRPAITTVLTTLDRLAEKGIVRREPDGRANRFFAAMTEDAVNQRIVRGVLDDLVGQFPEAVATYFAEQGAPDSDTARAHLRHLAERVESARTTRDSGESTGA
jgi:predicted transcriptional regulator